MKNVSKRLTAACLALLLATGGNVSSLPFSFGKSSSVIAASAEEAQEQTAKQRYLTLLEEAKALSADDYSADSYALFTARLKKFDKSLSVNNYEKRYTDYEYDKLCKGVKYAMRLLNTDKSHTYYNDLEKLISYGESLDSNDYTEKSYSAFLETFNSLKNGNYSLENASLVTKPVTLYETYLEQNYYPCFALLQGKDYSEVVKEDSATGIKLISNSNVIPNECSFIVDSFDSNNWDFVETDFNSKMKTTPSLCSNYVYYSFSIYNPDDSLLNIQCH